MGCEEMRPRKNPRQAGCPLPQIPVVTPVPPALPAGIRTTSLDVSARLSPARSQSIDCFRGNRVRRLAARSNPRGKHVWRNNFWRFFVLGPWRLAPSHQPQTTRAPRPQPRQSRRTESRLSVASFGFVGLIACILHARIIIRRIGNGDNCDDRGGRPHMDPRDRLVPFQYGGF
jgi:hypothetical protein